MAGDFVEIDKSSRHSKILGDYGENLICNWLSRSGFEVTIVDHTGIDIIAYNPKTEKRIGISVKSRTRLNGTESNPVKIYAFKKIDEAHKREMILDACKAFGCEPWIGIYVETQNYADLYLINLHHYESKYCLEVDKAKVWKMKDEFKEIYDNDPSIKHIRYSFDIKNWNYNNIII